MTDENSTVTEMSIREYLENLILILEMMKQGCLEQELGFVSATQPKDGFIQMEMKLLFRETEKKFEEAPLKDPVEEPRIVLIN